MEAQTYPPTPGESLRTLREQAGLSQAEVAAQFSRRTARQWVGRLERTGRPVSYVDAQSYRAAVDAAVAAKLAQAVAP